MTTSINIYKNSELIYSASSNDDAFEFLKTQENFHWEGVNDSKLINTNYRNLYKSNKSEWDRLQEPYYIDDTASHYSQKGLNKIQVEEIRTNLSKEVNKPSIGKNKIKLNDWYIARDILADFNRNPRIWMIKNNIEVLPESEDQKEDWNKSCSEWHKAYKEIKSRISLKEMPHESELNREMNKNSYYNKIISETMKVLKGEVKMEEVGKMKKERVILREAIDMLDKVEDKIQRNNEWQILMEKARLANGLAIEE